MEIDVSETITIKVKNSVYGVFERKDGSLCFSKTIIQKDGSEEFVNIELSTSPGRKLLSEPFPENYTGEFKYIILR